MSIFDRDEELDSIEALRGQTRDPFQLELLDAVKRRQKRETGFENENDRKSQHHSVELDEKMSKFLSNRQSPFHKDAYNKLGESSLKGDSVTTSSFGNSSIISKKYASSAHDSKWRPSVSIDSADDVEEEIASLSDDEDDIVIGNSAKNPDQAIVKESDKLNRNFGRKTHLNRGGPEPVDGIGKGHGIYKGRGRSPNEEKERIKPEKAASLLKGPVIQKTEGLGKGVQDPVSNNAPSMYSSRDKRLGGREKHLGHEDGTEGRKFGRRKPVGSLTNSDDEVDSINTRNLEDFDPSPRRKSKIDDIFDNFGSRKQNLLQGDEGNIRGNKKVRSESRGDSDRDSPVSFGRKSGSQSPRSRSGSGRESPADGLKPKGNKSASRDEGKSGRSRQELGKAKSVSNSGRSTPDGLKMSSQYGRRSPAEGLISSARADNAIRDEDKSRTRHSSGRESPGDLILAEAKGHESTKKRERPKSAKAQKDKYDDETNSSRYTEKRIEGRPSLRSSKIESKVAGEGDWRVRNDRSNSPGHGDERSSSHRRSKSIGNSPREIEDSQRESSPRVKTVGRERSKSYAEKLSDAGGKTRDVEKKEQEPKDRNLFGRKYSLKQSGSARSLHDKNAGFDSDEDTDDDFISVRRPSNVETKGTDNNEKRNSVMSNERKMAPNIRRPLGTAVLTKGKPVNEDEDGSTVDEQEKKGISAQRGGHDVVPKSGKDSLSKFKIKGRTTTQNLKTTPVRPKTEMKGAQSVLSKGREGEGTSPRLMNKTMTKRSLSFTNISNIKPKSPYSENADAKQRRNSIVDSETLREQIYYDWLKQKSTKTKEELRELRRIEKEKEVEAEREKKDKKIMSQKAFEAWQGNKEESLKDKKSQVKEKRMKEREKKDELLQKKLDSKKFFESWKTRKEEELVEQLRKKKEEGREKRRMEMQEKEDKLSSSKKVFENWKSRKEELLKEKHKAKKEEEKEKKLIEIEKMEKKRKAEKLFETWKETKEKSPREKATLKQRAWCPSGRNTGNAIPDGVRPVVQRNPPNRSRTASATGRLQNRTMMATYTRT